MVDILKSLSTARDNTIVLRECVSELYTLTPTQRKVIMEVLTEIDEKISEAYISAAVTTRKEA